MKSAPVLTGRMPSKRTNTIAFGKHKGKTYQDILKEDPEYLEYLLKWDELKPETRTIIEIVLEDRDYSIIPKGKFKGRRLTQELFNENVPYFQWMITNHKDALAAPRGASRTERDMRLSEQFFTLLSDFYDEAPDELCFPDNT